MYIVSLAKMTDQTNIHTPRTYTLYICTILLSKTSTPDENPFFPSSFPPTHSGPKQRLDFFSPTTFLPFLVPNPHRLHPVRAMIASLGQSSFSISTLPLLVKPSQATDPFIYWTLPIRCDAIPAPSPLPPPPPSTRAIASDTLSLSLSLITHFDPICCQHGRTDSTSIPPFLPRLLGRFAGPCDPARAGDPIVPLLPSSFPSTSFASIHDAPRIGSRDSNQSSYTSSCMTDHGFFFFAIPFLFFKDGYMPPPLVLFFWEICVPNYRSFGTQISQPTGLTLVLI